MPTANAPREALTRRLEAFSSQSRTCPDFIITNEGKESSA